MSSKLISLTNFALLAILFYSPALINCSLSNQNYNLDFSLPDLDLVYLEEFADLFDTTENEDEAIYNGEDEDYYDDEEEDDDDYIAQYSEKLLNNEKKTLDSLSDPIFATMRKINAKLLVHNTLRESYISYSEDLTV